VTDDPGKSPTGGELAPDDAPMVAASERDLITMARALVAPHAYDAWLLLGRTRTLPPKIGPTCAMLLEDALRQVWPALWRRGARPGTSLAGTQLRVGRGWERHAAQPLAFTAATIELLRWLVATPLANAPTAAPSLGAMPLALGDQVAIYLALAFADGTPAQLAIARQPFAREAPLAWLGFANLMTGTPDVAFDQLASGAGAIVVEALADELAGRWRTAELGKRALVSPDTAIELGAAQDATLERFMAACDRHRRRDLGGFLLDAAAPLIARGLQPTPAALDPDAPLSERVAARVAAGALLRAIARWGEWDRQHRGVRFIDDDYAIAQHLLARFERVGQVGADRAAAWLADLAALSPAPASTTIDSP
jgi:hypothetical protein